MNMTCPVCGAEIKERHTKMVILGTSGTMTGYCCHCKAEASVPIDQKESERIRSEFFLTPTVVDTSQD